jgi:hypothetical protein
MRRIYATYHKQILSIEQFLGYTSTTALPRTKDYRNHAIFYVHRLVLLLALFLGAS